jgi:hypothetical protein
MTLKKIRLELARTPQFPEGSPRHGYEFTAPLDAKGHLDAPGWAKAKEACVVRRFWDGQPDEHGRLIHHRGAQWAFSYHEGEPEEDEPIFRFDKHHFAVGEYVTITEHDGVARPFRVAEIKPAPHYAS